MKVGPTLIRQLADRFLKNVENELRTQALLLGEPYQRPTGILGQLLPRKKLGKHDDYMDAFMHAMMYGTAMHSTMFKPQGTVTGRLPPQPQPQPIRPVGNRISGSRPDKVTFDDIAELEKKFMANMSVRMRGFSKSGMFAAAYSGMHDEILMDFSDPVPEQGALPRAEPNRGPQPRKPHIHRRKK